MRGVKPNVISAGGGKRKQPWDSEVLKSPPLLRSHTESFQAGEGRTVSAGRDNKGEYHVIKVN